MNIESLPGSCEQDGTDAKNGYEKILYPARAWTRKSSRFWV